MDDGLAHVHAGLSAHFMELHSFFLEQLEVLFLYLLVGLVALVGKNVGLRILRVDLALFEPEVHDVVEGLGVVDIVHQNNCLCAFVVGFGDAAEPLLPRRVPYLELHVAIIDHDGPK